MHPISPDLGLTSSNIGRWPMLPHFAFLMIINRVQAGLLVQYVILEHSVGEYVSYSGAGKYVNFLK